MGEGQQTVPELASFSLDSSDSGARGGMQRRCVCIRYELIHEESAHGIWLPPSVVEPFRRGA